MRWGAVTQTTTLSNTDTRLMVMLWISYLRHGFTLLYILLAYLLCELSSVVLTLEHAFAGRSLPVPRLESILALHESRHSTSLHFKLCFTFLLVLGAYVLCIW